MVFSGPPSKALAGLTLALLSSALTIVPALAHKVKSDSDSSAVSITATVADVCALQQGQSITLPAYNSSSNTGGGPINFNLGYYCSGSPTLISFQTAWTWTNRADCVAYNPPQNYLFFALWYQGNQVNCNPGSDPGAGPGITNAPAGTGFNQEVFLPLTVGVDLASGFNDGLPAGTYTTTITVGITP